ncbi:MAG TPA: diaminopimelate decarboxylase [Cytophagales bacterium]|nr:diaminopimelate decarboxylase [Cytophagales bacterium]
MILKNERFSLQGVDLLEVAEQYGTPVYVYDAERILGQINQLKSAFSQLPLKLKYATKALSNLNILKIIKLGGCGLDVVSIQEARLGLMAGFAPEDIMFTPNCTPFAEIEQAVDLGLYLNIDNLPFLERFGQLYGSSYPVCIRINPHIVAGGNEKIKTGHAESKFGISIDQQQEIYEIVKKYNIAINGVHVHTGSDFSDVDVFLKGAEVVFSVAKNFPNLEFIDFGSGFKVAYKEGDKTTDVQELGAKMTARFQTFCKEYGRELAIWFEPGKYLVSDSGLLLVNVNVVKKTPAATFLGVNSGLNHLIRPMMYSAHHDIVNLSNTSQSKKKYAVVGYICETDTFAWDMELSEAHEGDVLAIKNAGAYGFSMSSNYNSRFRPAEVLIHEGKVHLIRKREVFEDLLKNQVLADL